ncbi:pantetheine-phosphate adenylyltransferase [Candidatus Endowatersipora endosymbiont of Watersipora subatra]|uniref:pantetheine-phosphate adenylyltransferase n=1 Tax=Candidatus Endowatersipora endosymbiont of Watersipora subatra TaxID=3077946 RepID=UPI003C7EAAF9
MIKKALYPGSFDPFTNGHLDILIRALNIADHVIIGIGKHATKERLLTFNECKFLIEKILYEINKIYRDRISIHVFDNLVIDVARSLKATILIRGLRDSTDLNYEIQMAGMNSSMASEIQTVFLLSSPEVRFITTKLVRQIVQMGGDIKSFVPKAVADTLESKLSKNLFANFF